MEIEEKNRDINIEEIHPELLGALEVPKSLKKMTKITEKLLSRINDRFKGERDFLRKKLEYSTTTVQKNIDNFISSTNSDLEAFKKRYNAIYGDLVSRVMVKLEGRVFSAEIFEQATLDLCVEKLYKLEKNIPLDEDLGSNNIDYQAYIEDCASKHEAFMQKHVDAFAERQKGKQDAQVVQEKTSKDETSRRAEDESGS